MESAVHYSRPVRAAESLGDQAPGQHQFTDKPVLLEADREALRTRNGELCFLFSLRLLPRFCKHVTVYIPEASDAFISQCRAEADRIVFSGELRFVTTLEGRDQFTAVLHVGAAPFWIDHKTVLINSNGWVARVSRTKPISGITDQTNPVAAMAAASWGCAEIFKLLVDLREDRGTALESVEYSLFDYTATNSLGPLLPKELPLARGLLLGFGAIGNAVLAVTSELPFRGHLDVVDYQKFGSENLGTCMLIGPDDVSHGKAQIAERWTSGQFTIKGHVMRLEHYVELVDKSIPHPWVVLTAPDSSEPRREAQGLWPDVAINGAIGEFEAEVGVHPAEGDIACMRCLFKPRTNFDWVSEVSKGTGLAPDRIAKEGDSLVTAEDVEKAPEEHKSWLAERIGKPICSIAEEGLARRISKDRDMPEDFQPSLPFVASLSAAFMCGELVKFVMGTGTTVAPRIQHDILQGPSTALMFEQARTVSCECVMRTKNITKFREAMKVKEAQRPGAFHGGNA